jgi:hypothetical protein
MISFNATYSLHDIAEKIVNLELNNNHSLTLTLKITSVQTQVCMWTIGQAELKRTEKACPYVINVKCSLFSNFVL